MAWSRDPRILRKMAYCLLGSGALSSAEPYEFLVKLRNITWETNYVIVSQNALGMMGRRKLRFVNHRSHPPSRTTKCPLLSLHYPYKSYIIDSAEESGSRGSEYILSQLIYRFDMDLARAPCRAPLTARKKGSGYENEIAL